MTHYQKHVFFCTNQRDNGKRCCQGANASAMRDYAKQKIKALGLAGKGGIRINTAGCMGRCSEGPTIVIYPDGVWYSYKTQADVDEIIEKHLLNGEIVDRLLLSQEGG